MIIPPPCKFSFLFLFCLLTIIIRYRPTSAYSTAVSTNALALRDNDNPSTSNQATSTAPGRWLRHSGLSNQPTPSPFRTGYNALRISYPQLVSTLSFLLHLHFLSLFSLTNFKPCVDSHYHRTSTTMCQHLPPPHAKRRR